MKTNSHLTSPVSSRFSTAFTLPETMITMAIFSLAVAGLLTSFLLGAKMYRITEAKLSASDQARKVISNFSDEVRTAARIKIGSGGLSSFTEVVDGSLQQGNAVQVYPTSSTNLFVRYYWDLADRRLKRTTNGSSAVIVLARSVTNSVVFTSEDFAGRILTNNQNNRVIGFILDFDQVDFGQIFDFYQYRSKITRRALE